jgi:uncharacterized protein YdeI (YjbR/CyaY-like superfamily)
MQNTDPRIDQYILNASGFAVPVMNHLRQIVHQACPDVKETMKWSFPHFDYRGSILCSMAAFKNHCAFNIWLGNQLSDPHKLLLSGDAKTSMGNLGKIQKIEDLPSDEILIGYLKEALSLSEKGAKLIRNVKDDAPKTLEIPEYFLKALETNLKAKITFEKFSYSHKKEYVNWITEAKTEATKEKRIQTSLDWLAEGKPQNWKYMK